MFKMRTTRLPFKVLLILCRFELIGFHRKAKCFSKIALNKMLVSQNDSCFEKFLSCEK